ncbi:class I SAM-dependent methyltransferase [Tsukamurella sp. 8F]|uniref:class I SAM-dependent methyltransferase n=1 Tax=unclassified Tsukamurella TaxID=2633480 RepID=UPI0023BA3D50|nr:MULTISPECIES: class I SAM-dependent methyltransferase [unclassified Tsukamurella]MDF0530388.1 class I SAM-dependent methyltransferase [Tsukamurella sp. 8J]MDF0587791.1 class I SAM-dependent methyltransferase [Tsukamurella sp. 8F]
MAFAPARRQLLDQTMHDRGLDGAGSRALVVGGGYSPIAADLRDRGFDVTAVDPSPAATEIARADTPGVTFRTAPPTALGVDSTSFDLVYAADTLEITDDLDTVLAQLSDAARPGSTVVLDTVTDTVIAKLVYLIAFPRLPFTRIMPADRYVSSRLRNPRDLKRACRRAGMNVDSIIGFEPASLASLVRAVLGRRAGRITDDDLPGVAGFHLGERDHAPVVTYFAIATAS